MRAVGAGLAAVDAVIDGKAANAFCQVRPPGHHAEADRAMGFCLFSNAAIAGLYARAKHGAERIAIVDFDVHHGNGTQDIFYRGPVADRARRPTGAHPLGEQPVQPPGDQHRAVDRRDPRRRGSAGPRSSRRGRPCAPAGCWCRSAPGRCRRTASRPGRSTVRRSGFGLGVGSGPRRPTGRQRHHTAGEQRAGHHAADDSQAARRTGRGALVPRGAGRHRSAAC